MSYFDVKRGGLRPLLVAFCIFLPIPAFSAVTISSPFNANYSVQSTLTLPVTINGPYAGVSFSNGDPNTILLSGDANNPNGQIYTVPVTRGSNNHITGFGTPAVLSTAPGIDGGLSYGPVVQNGVSPAGSVLFFTDYTNNKIGQIKSGSSSPDLMTDLGLLNTPVAPSTGGLGFVPTGFSGAGRLKITSYNSNQWYDATVTLNVSGTYDIQTTGVVVNLPPIGAEAIVFVGSGSPNFTSNSTLIAGFNSSTIEAFDVNSNGDPIVASQRTFATGLNGATGAAIDPLTGDFIFTSYSTSDLTVVSGFVSPTPAPTVTSVSPTSGAASGGTNITITGTDLLGATGITVNGTACTAFNVSTATTATCTTPAGTVGAASVVVTTSSGSNATNTFFTYTAAPAPAAVPTLSQWSQMLLAFLLMSAMVYYGRKQRSH